MHSNTTYTTLPTVSPTMIRQLLLRRPRHVSCTPLPTKVCYSQALTAKLGAILNPWKKMAVVVSSLTQRTIHVHAEPDVH
jgi:hypothetical protein